MFVVILLTDSIQNDEIEKLSLERSALYRKCRLEEIELPLLEGDLRNVPMEEVRLSCNPLVYGILITIKELT